MTNKILFIVPDGVGIRNYLYSNVFNQLYQKAEVVIYTPLPEKAIVEAVNHKAVEVQKFIFDRESIITKIFREAATFARLLHNARLVNNDTILTNWNYKPKGIKLKIVNTITMFLGRWATKKYARILNFERIANSGWSNTVIEKHVKHLQATSPSKIFITHQRVASIMPICIAAKKLNIEVVSVIYSWDNLPKARLAVSADKYLVWSDYMKAEMTKYYPEIDINAIIVTGTPQFEFYYKKDLIKTKQEFAHEYGLDANKKWICFSGDDTKTSPYDPIYLNDLANELNKSDHKNDYQIIFRRCPVDFSDRYNKVLKENKDIIIPINPSWNVPSDLESWGVFFPKKEDLGLQVNIAHHCDFVVNLGSTMALDFAVFNKPCFYVNYDVVENPMITTATIYNFEHFKSMKNFKAVIWVNSIAYYHQVLNNLEEINELTKEKNLWLETIVNQPLDSASGFIVNELLSNLYQE